MTDNLKTLTDNAAAKVKDAIHLVESSINSVLPFDVQKKYTPKKLKPFDAMCGKFISAVEFSSKFFRTYEMFMYGENSETIRDLLNRMEILEFISRESSRLLNCN